MLRLEALACGEGTPLKAPAARSQLPLPIVRRATRDDMRLVLDVVLVGVLLDERVDDGGALAGTRS